MYTTVAKQLNLDSDESEPSHSCDSVFVLIMVEAAAAYGNSVGDWPSFEDTPRALRLLHDAGLKLVILSNVDNNSFEG